MLSLERDTLVGDFLREARLRRGYTQKQLAAASYTTQSVISRLERGEYSPTVRTLGRLVAAMDGELRLELVTPNA